MLKIKKKKKKEDGFGQFLKVKKFLKNQKENLVLF